MIWMKERSWACQDAHVIATQGKAYIDGNLQLGNRQWLATRILSLTAPLLTFKLLRNGGE